MPTLAELKQSADESLFAGAFEDALRLYVQIIELAPLHLDARLRVADALLALGEVQRAAVVYTRLAQYAAHAGYPLRALTALKVLSALEPELGPLVHGVAELYARDSGRLGKSARRSLPGGELLVPRGSLAPDDLRDDLVRHAEHLASDYAHKEALFPEKLMPIPLLSSLGIDELTRVFAATELVRVRPAATIVAQGSHGDSMFLLARGSVRVERRQGDDYVQPLATLHEGAIFGELSFLSGAQRNAAVIAIGDCDLLELSRARLGRESAEAQLLAVVSSFARDRMLAHVMANSRLFAPLDTAQRLDLIKRFVPLEVPSFAAIVRQGDPSAGAYVVLRGEVAVRVQRDARSIELARLGPGELFGEMSLLSGAGASANVEACEPTSLLFLGKPYFDRLLAAVPELRAELEQLSDRRSRQIAASFPPSEEDELIEVEVLL